MAIDLSAATAPISFHRVTLHATAGNLDVLTLPRWVKQLTIRAAGTGSVKVSHTGNQDAAISATLLHTVPVGDSVTLRSVQLSNYPIRLTGSVNSDAAELILESELHG